MASQDNYRVVVTYDNSLTAVVDNHSGGEKTHDNQSYRRAGGKLRIQPSRATYGDLTIGWLAGDEPELERRMRKDPISRPMTVKVIPLGVDDTPDPRQDERLYVGRFAGCTDPDSDVNGTDTSVFEATMSVEDIQ